MTSLRFSKEKISVQRIGAKRFWIGIGTGLISAISISFFFQYSREALRYMTLISADLLVLEVDEIRYYDYFFSILAAVLGLAVCLGIWMQNKYHKRNKDRIYKQLSRTYALLIFWIILLVTARFGSILPMILFGLPGYDDHLNLFEHYGIIFILMPIVVFMQCWFSVRLIYRSGKWIFASLIICLFTAFFLSLTSSVDQKPLNQAYFQIFRTEYQYIDDEIQSAEDNYGVQYDQNTLQTLKSWSKESALNQVRAVKAAFGSGRQVSLDTIILQKIIVRNFKRGILENHERDFREYWDYALPDDILRQLITFEVNQDQATELFGILKEQIDLVNTPYIDSKEQKKYTRTERRRSTAVRFHIPASIPDQLRTVRYALLQDESFSDMAKGLPEIREGDKKVDGI